MISNKMKFMTKKFLLMANCLLFSFFAIAQTETFDIASFIAPKGWQRIDTKEYWHLLIRKQVMVLPVSARSIYFQAIKATALLKKILKQNGITRLPKP
jgi:hypothetical protein